ncbi:MAG: hypothetical protein KDC44_05085, partial [Phaeodactylibacter sp.]|nr:hypothetical protein [Phaeodactylibacter sp.]
MNFRNALLFALLGMLSLVLPAQNLEWVYAYTGEGATLPIGTTVDDWAMEVIVDHEGNILTAGRLAGRGDVDFMATEAYPATPDLLSMYLCKYTPDGELLWANPVFSGMTPSDFRPELAVDAANNVYFISHFYEATDIDPGPDEVLLTPAGDADVMLVKYKADGSFEWVVHLGSFDDERIDGLAIDADGNVVVSGQLAEPIDFDPGPGEALEVPTEIALTPFLAKYTSDGEYLWSGLLQITEEVDDFSYALPYGLDTDADNNIYLAGALLGEMDADLSADTFSIGYTAPGDDLFLAKYDPNGTLQWGFALNGLTLDYLTDLRADKQGHVYIAGFISEGQTDFDPGPGEYFLPVAGGESSFLAKYTEAGELVWAFKLGNTNYSRVNTIDFDPEGNIVLAGQMNFSMDADPGPDVVLLNPASKSGYICTYSPDMEYISSLIIDGNAESNVLAAATGPEGQYYAAGLFRKTADFDPGPNTCVLHAENNPVNQSVWADGFLAKYTPWCVPADPFIFSKDSLKLCAGDTLVIDIPDSLDLHNSCCWLLYEGACGSNAVDSAKYGSLQVQVFESGYYYVGANGSCPGQQLCDSVYVKVPNDSVTVL